MLGLVFPSKRVQKVREGGKERGKTDRGERGREGGMEIGREMCGSETEGG